MTLTPGNTVYIQSGPHFGKVATVVTPIRSTVDVELSNGIVVNVFTADVKPMVIGGRVDAFL